MNNEIIQISHERCHQLGTPPFLPQSYLGSIGHSILVVMGPKVNMWNKERKGCTNNLKNMVEAFVTMVHKNYLLKIAFPFHSSFFLFSFFFLFQFILHFFFFFLVLLSLNNFVQGPINVKFQPNSTIRIITKQFFANHFFKP